MLIGLTGSSSGLGRRLIDFLIQGDYQVRALTRDKSRINYPQNKNISYITGDITQPATLTDFVKGIDLCIHLAAQVDYTTRKEYFRVNYTGTGNLCRAVLRENPDCRVIYCSTITALRVKPWLRINSTLYALSKYYAEKLVLKYADKAGLKVTVIYPGVIFGFYDRHVIPALTRFIQSGKVLLLRGGETKAPLIYTDDLCALFIKVIANPVSIGKKYISVKGLDMGVHDFIRTVCAQLGCKSPPGVYPALPLGILAVVLNFIYRLLRIREQPPLTRAVVDVLSGTMRKYRKVYDDPCRDLGWVQDPSKETVTKQITAALDFFLNSQ